MTTTTKHRLFRSSQNPPKCRKKSITVWQFSGRAVTWYGRLGHCHSTNPKKTSPNTMVSRIHTSKVESHGNMDLQSVLLLQVLLKTIRGSLGKSVGPSRTISLCIVLIVLNPQSVVIVPFIIGIPKHPHHHVYHHRDSLSQQWNQQLDKIPSNFPAISSTSWEIHEKKKNN